MGGTRMVEQLETSIPAIVNFWNSLIWHFLYVKEAAVTIAVTFYVTFYVVLDGGPDRDFDRKLDASSKIQSANSKFQSPKSTLQILNSKVQFPVNFLLIPRCQSQSIPTRRKFLKPDGFASASMSNAAGNAR